MKNRKSTAIMNINELINIANDANRKKAEAHQQEIIDQNKQLKIGFLECVANTTIDVLKRTAEEGKYRHEVYYDEYSGAEKCDYIGSLVDELNKQSRLPVTLEKTFSSRDIRCRGQPKVTHNTCTVDYVWKK